MLIKQSNASIFLNQHPFKHRVSLWLYLEETLLVLLKLVVERLYQYVIFYFYKYFIYVQCLCLI